ncbi:MAG: C39 family peptidase [Rhodospirillales bacterium]|nr:C39 family peptidase [Rhodospirillales bacterium]
MTFSLPVRCGSRGLAVGILTAAALAVTAPAKAGRVGIQFAAGGQFNVGVTSVTEARFKTVIRQRYDFSCGSAALASLLTFHYERPTAEEATFRAMYIAGDKERIQRSGFSLLDMKTYLAGEGLRADGFRVSLDKLAAAKVPAITLINANGYKHFVLIKGIRGDEVVVGDPAAGVKVYGRAAFSEMWEGIAFIIRDEPDVAHRHFNSDRDWAVRVKAPFGTALDRQSLASFNVNLPAATGRY